MTVMTLTEFLKARLDEAEAHAQKDIWIVDRTTPGAWQGRYGHNIARSELRADGQPIAIFTGGAHQGDAMLAARFKPATVRERAERVLAEVDAKRRIVELHHWETDPALRALYGVLCSHCSAVSLGAYREWPCPTLLLLALPYAGHADYDESWRP